MPKPLPKLLRLHQHLRRVSPSLSLREDKPGNSGSLVIIESPEFSSRLSQRKALKALEAMPDNSSPSDVIAALRRGKMG